MTIKHDQQLYELFQSQVLRLGYELLGVERLQQERYKTIRLYIDKVNGVNVDDCAKVNHELMGILDVEDPITGQYNFEVSSPGLDRPLFTLEQFERFIGERIKLLLNQKVNNRKRLLGQLTSVVDDNVIIKIDSEKFNIPFKYIKKANLVYQF